MYKVKSKWWWDIKKDLMFRQLYIKSSIITNIEAVKNNQYIKSDLHFIFI